MCYNAGMTQETLFQELYSRYGAVKRARGPFLYTERGVRIVDMYQENGRAVLGWGGGSAFTHLKNVLSRGLTGSYRTVFSFQLAKALETDPNYLIMGEKVPESNNGFMDEATDLLSKIMDPKVQELLLKQIRALV